MKRSKASNQKPPVSKEVDISIDNFAKRRYSKADDKTEYKSDKRRNARQGGSQEGMILESPRKVDYKSKEDQTKEKPLGEVAGTEIEIQSKNNKSDNKMKSRENSGKGA